jgi:ureidoglycolate dehydrogenase (NAD+)
MNPRPNIQVIKETPAVLFVEADRAFGPVVTVPVLERVLEKARAVGIGWALIRNLTHQGAIGYYSLLAAQQGMAGITIVCSPPNMAPYGAKAAGLHNAPIAIAVPAGRHHPLVLDMATSVAAGGKLSLAQDKRVPLGAGWALDADGNPTTDPFLAQILLPAGGAKGSGLALLFQALTSQMAGNPLVVPVLDGAPNTNGQNSVVAAIDIGLFTDLEEYKAGIDEMIDRLKALPKADGFSEVLMPGEPEYTTLAERSRQGIPLPPGTVDKLRAAAQRFSLPLPPGLG